MTTSESTKPVVMHTGLGDGIAWAGFWLGSAAVACTAILNGWKPWA